MQADPNKKNMERMEERVPHADEQRLQHMLSDSPWDHRAVIDRVALEADGLIGGERNGGLLIDESGFKKSGSHSVGVARQGCGRLGKVDNCQVGVFAALGGDRRVTLVDERLYLPEKWTDEPPRCEQAAIPEAVRRFETKVALALERVAPQRRLGVRFSWVGADGFYGTDPAFLRGLEAMGEVWVADGHCDQRIFLEDPKPTPKERKGKRGRQPTKLEANAPAMRVERWQSEQPHEAWERLKVRDGNRGEREVEIVHQRVWLWDGEESEGHCWHLIVRREVGAPAETEYTLSNAPAETGAQRLAEMQAQRYGVERAFQDGKSEGGRADYPVRKWSAWPHPMAVGFMAMLFMLEERIQAKDTHPLLSCSDLEERLRHFLPKRAVTQEEVFEQMEKRPKKRSASIRSHYAKQGIDLLE